jgi:hypothetical protein
MPKEAALTDEIGIRVFSDYYRELQKPWLKCTEEQLGVVLDKILPKFKSIDHGEQYKIAADHVLPKTKNSAESVRALEEYLIVKGQ